MTADSLTAMGALVSPYGLVVRTANAVGEPRIPVGVGTLGELGEIFTQLDGWRRSMAIGGNFDGAGGDLDPARRTPRRRRIARALRDPRRARRPAGHRDRRRAGH
ncbi:hypothetical protein [Amycolatopsis sp. NPDC059657]|uniref:hypothetical protein n=1 Tax=Amycolatopsis sp. NPDC059657 TaxID=3346899 RepID=UPI0036702C39